MFRFVSIPNGKYKTYIMKYIKLFERFEEIDEVEDYLLELIESGMVRKGEDGKNFQEIKLVKKTSGGAWIPTHYSIEFVLNIKTTLTSLEDLEFNKNLFEKVYQIVYRFGSDFKISGNQLTLFIECSDSIRNFFARWSVGKNMIDLDPPPPGKKSSRKRIVSAFSIDKIEDDFSIIFKSYPLGKTDINEVLDFVKNEIKSDDEYKYNTEVYSSDDVFKYIYIKVKR